LGNCNVEAKVSRFAFSRAYELVEAELRKRGAIGADTVAQKLRSAHFWLSVTLRRCRTTALCSSGFSRARAR
jgi:hypothetical protein